MPPLRFILALSLLLAALPLGTSSEMVTYKLQHAFGLTAAFQDRGSIEVLVDSGALTLIPPSEDQIVLVPEGSLDEIAREMRQPDGGLYRLRAQRSDTSAPVIMTSVHLCDLVRAGFRENITLTLDVDGRLLGLEYTPRMSRLSPTTCLAMKSPLDEVNRNSDGTRKDAIADKGPSAFSTLIKAAVDQAGQSLPVVVPGQRPPMIQIRYDEQERKPEVEKSFLQKYVRQGREGRREGRGTRGSGHRHTDMTVNRQALFLPSIHTHLSLMLYVWHLHHNSGSLSSWLSYFSTRGQRHRKKKEVQEEEQGGKDRLYNEDMGRACRGEEEGKNGTEPTATEQKRMKA